MGRYLIRRAMFLLLVIVLISVLTFLIFMKLPAGDPAVRNAGRTQTPETIAAVREALGLDKPLLVQYGRFAKGLIPWPPQRLLDPQQPGLWLNDEVYFSWSNNVPVWEELKPRIFVTMWLAIGAAFFWLLLGVPIGIVSAIRRRSLVDRGGMLFALLGVSMPVFWLGYMFIFIFSIRLHLLPGAGIPTDENTFQAVLHGRFLMPWLVLMLSFAAFYARMTRGNLIETMTEDYIRTARAKGLSERRVIFKHGLRSALTPVVTMFGMDLGILLGGAVITEQVFNLNGIGKYLVDSLTREDFPATMGVTIFASFFIVVANLVVDVVYAFLDPRVRYT
jgi:peptide/nickel transport system permease protein